MTQRPKPIPPKNPPSYRKGMPKPQECWDQFLENLRQGMSIAKAAVEAGTARRTVCDKRLADEEFAKAWEDAYNEGTDRLEDEAMRRARDGVQKPVFQGGQLVGHVQEYSDTLATLMLAGRRPEKYKKQSVELSGPDGGPVQATLAVEFVGGAKK